MHRRAYVVRRSAAPGARARDLRPSCVLAGLFALALGAAACGDDDFPYYTQCRYQPGLCAGGPGAFCGNNADCAVGYCCTERKQCGGGMCALPCKNDVDCPYDMACEHDKCFFRCSSNLDCADGQTCAHGHTVCEWP